MQHNGSNALQSTHVQRDEVRQLRALLWYAYHGFAHASTSLRQRTSNLTPSVLWVTGPSLAFRVQGE